MFIVGPLRLPLHVPVEQYKQYGPTDTQGELPVPQQAETQLQLGHPCYGVSPWRWLVFW